MSSWISNVLSKLNRYSNLGAKSPSEKASLAVFIAAQAPSRATPLSQPPSDTLFTHILQNPSTQKRQSVTEKAPFEGTACLPPRRRGTPTTLRTGFDGCASDNPDGSQGFLSQDKRETRDVRKKSVTLLRRMTSNDKSDTSLTKRADAPLTVTATLSTDLRLS